MRPSPPSLRDSALLSVSDNLELVCYGVSRGSQELLKLLDSGQYKSVAGPLTELPGSVLEDLIEVVCMDRGCPQHLLHLLLQPQIRTCKLHQRWNRRAAAKLLLQRCNKITCLEITYCTSYSIEPGFYTQFFQTFPSLTIINLEGTSVDDFAIEQIGLHCQNLRWVNLAESTTSDRGLSYLTTTRHGEPAAQKLSHINLKNTAVTPKGVATFLLNHTNIYRLEYETFEEVLQCFESLSLSESGEAKVTSLREIFFLNCRSDMGTIEKTATFCPYLDSFCLKKTDLSRQVLSVLPALKYLTRLELGNSSFTQYTLYFHETVVPLLEELGHQLTHLSLEKFKFVDISLIGESCPKIQSFKLSRILSFYNVESHKKHLFQKLDCLHVLNTRGSRVTAATLRQLMANSQRLRTIHLQFIAAFNDKFCDDLLKENPMLQIHTVIFEQCHGLTLESLMMFLSQPSSLEVLSCWSCANIGALEREAVLELVKKENLVMQFQLYSSRMIPYPEDLEELELMGLQDRQELVELIGIHVLPYE